MARSTNNRSAAAAAAAAEKCGRGNQAHAFSWHRRLSLQQGVHAGHVHGHVGGEIDKLLKLGGRRPGWARAGHERVGGGRAC
jgi:hypothetical protein